MLSVEKHDLSRRSRRLKAVSISKGNSRRVTLDTQLSYSSILRTPYEGLDQETGL